MVVLRFGSIHYLNKRVDFEALEAVFREKFITAAHTQLQRQMAVLSRSQRQGETVDEYTEN